VAALAPEPGGWCVRLGEGDRLHAESVVLAAPPRAAAAIVPFAPEAASGLVALPTASSVSVSLTFAAEAVSHPLAASGVVFDGADEELAGLCACTFSSSKFAGRAPAGMRLLRVLFRPPPTEIALDRADWRERALHVLTPLLGLREPPRRCWIARWPQVRPRYAVDHAAAVDAIARQLREYGPIELAGAAFHPSGVEGAIASGRLAAERVLGGMPSAARTGVA
jgi:oxygen-dependent protoporphyrinogen oxidase